MQSIDQQSNQIVCKDSIKEIQLNENKLSIDKNEFLVGNCFYDATPSTAVFTRTSLNDRERDGIEHAFSLLSTKFGRKSNFEDVFELFGEFESGQSNILFSDDADALETAPNDTTDDSESLFKDIQCNE